MRLDMNRICQLAGIASSSKSSNGLIREGKGHDDGTEQKETVTYEGDASGDQPPVDEEEKKDKDGPDDDVNEMVEIDEVMLVQELRRAKRLMKESRKRKNAKKQKLQEMQLRAVIDQEVKNVIKELQLNSGWVYGDRRPTRSKKGYTHQGSFLKGPGFK